MRILVTGSLGTLGRPLVAELRERGHEVWGTDLTHNGDPQYTRADVANFPSSPEHSTPPGRTPFITWPPSSAG